MFWCRLTVTLLSCFRSNVNRACYCVAKWKERLPPKYAESTVLLWEFNNSRIHLSGKSCRQIRKERRSCSSAALSCNYGEKLPCKFSRHEETHCFAWCLFTSWEPDSSHALHLCFSYAFSEFFKHQLTHETLSVKVYLWTSGEVTN